MSGARRRNVEFCQYKSRAITITKASLRESISVEELSSSSLLYIKALELRMKNGLCGVDCSKTWKREGVKNGHPTLARNVDVIEPQQNSAQECVQNNLYPRNSQRFLQKSKPPRPPSPKEQKRNVSAARGCQNGVTYAQNHIQK